MSVEAYFDCCQAAKTLGHKDDCKYNTKNVATSIIAFDDPQELNVMQLTIPIKKLALDPNAMQAMVEFHGFFEVAKDQALAIMHTHRLRARQAKSNIILPGNNGNAPPGVKLEVH